MLVGGVAAAVALGVGWLDTGELGRGVVTHGVRDCVGTVGGLEGRDTP